MSELDSRVETLLGDMIAGDSPDIVPRSRVEQILVDLINSGSSDVKARSRVETLLKELEVGGGVTILSGNSEPSAGQGSNGDVYLLYGTSAVDLSTFSTKKESGMSVACVSDLIAFTYDYGGNIGAQAYKQIDLTSIDAITFTLKSGHHAYDGYSTDRFAPMALLENTKDPATGFVADSIAYIPGTRISTNDTTITKTVDVTELTGNYWLVFSSNGCDSTVQDVELTSGNAVVNAYAKVSGIWQPLIGTNIDDINLGN